MLYGLLALVSAAIAVASFLYYQQNANMILFVVAIIFILLTLGFGAMFLAGRVNKTEDIHITE